MNSDDRELAGKRVLVTGGTGSFGQTVAANLLTHDVAEVRIFSRDESKQDLMRREFRDDRLRYIIGDVRDPWAVRRAVEGTDHIFHAAALKQVPSCEFFPMEAVMTNISGSYNVIEAARAEGVGSVVCLSTDKAVLPINAMGMTKALMEKLVQAHGRTAGNGTRICTVRYGNVLYSRGSVVPLFVDQVMAGDEITVTNPLMTRFLMPLDHAIELVLYAFAQGQSGETFVRRAPAANMDDLAHAVADLFGVEPRIRIIGTRHAEKLYETLITKEESIHATDEAEFVRIGLDERGLNYTHYYTEGDPEATLKEDYTSHNTEQLGPDQTRQLLAELPEVKEKLEVWGRD